MLDRIVSIKARIVAFEDAVTTLAVSGISSYTIDTGQSRQTVTRLDLPNLQSALNGLYNQLVVLEARCSGNGTIIARPSW